MTLKEKAIEYVERNYDGNDSKIKRFAMVSFMDGYEQAKKEDTAQIEKMKCCGNCKHFWTREDNGIGKCNNPTQKECTLGIMDKWELAE